MKSYRFSAVVESDGSLHLSGLPPEQAVEIVVIERTGPPEELQQWMEDLRTRHPFAKMSKEEILEVLRQTREQVTLRGSNSN